jgi:phospho-N-acetylmuramoyl-pentapeptide-transferase
MLLDFIIHHPIIVVAIAMAVTYLLTIGALPPMIRFLRARKLGQALRDDVADMHKAKAGTPTMGGVALIAATAIGSLGALGLFCFIKPELPTRYHDLLAALALIGLCVAMAAIGAIDDWGKIRRGRNLGLKAREKLILQFVVAGLFVWALVGGLDYQTTIGVPFLALDIRLGGWYWPFAILYIAAMSNAANLTDGLDGLAGGVTTVTALAVAAMAWFCQKDPAAILGPGAAAFAACLAAACVGFLKFNRFPAKVFMGDTGSLAIGAALAGVGLALKQEVVVLFIALVYLVEMGTVILQVLYFKLTRGKRLFLMTPYHHALEKRGWSEPTIVRRAVILTLITATVGLAVFAFWR